MSREKFYHLQAIFLKRGEIVFHVSFLHTYIGGSIELVGMRVNRLNKTRY